MSRSLREVWNSTGCMSRSLREVWNSTGCMSRSLREVWNSIAAATSQICQSSSASPPIKVRRWVSSASCGVVFSFFLLFHLLTAVLLANTETLKGPEISSKDLWVICHGLLPNLKTNTARYLSRPAAKPEDQHRALFVTACCHTWRPTLRVICHGLLPNLKTNNQALSEKVKSQDFSGLGEYLQTQLRWKKTKTLNRSLQ